MHEDAMIVRLLLVSAMLLGGCDDSPAEEVEAQPAHEGATPSAEVDTASEAPHDDEELEAVALAATGDVTHAAGGLEVRIGNDGTVIVDGIDRWGNEVHTTYADADYFRNAVPVLMRSSTEEQQTALTAALEALPNAESP